MFLPLNHLASKVVVQAQDNLMKARDERTALMNETLQGIRMLKVSPIPLTIFSKQNKTKEAANLLDDDLSSSPVHGLGAIVRG